METTYVWVDPKGMKAYKTTPDDDRKALEKKGWVLTSISDAFDFLGNTLGWGKSENFGTKSQDFLTKMAIRADRENNGKIRKITSQDDLTVAPDDYNIVRSDSVFNTVGPDNPDYKEYFHPKSEVDSSKTSQPAATSTVSKGSKKNPSNNGDSGLGVDRVLKALGYTTATAATVAAIAGAIYAAKKGKFEPAKRLVKRAVSGNPSAAAALRLARIKVKSGFGKVADTATGWWNGAKKWFVDKTTRAGQSPVTPTSSATATPSTGSTITVSPSSSSLLGTVPKMSNRGLSKWLTDKFKGEGIKITNSTNFRNLIKDIRNGNAPTGSTLADLKSMYKFKRGGILIKRK